MRGNDNVGGLVPHEWKLFSKPFTPDIVGIGPNDKRISDTGGIGELSFATFAPVVSANTRNGEFPVARRGDDNAGTLVQGDYEIFTQSMDSMAVFVDAFETADTSGRSAAVP